MKAERLKEELARLEQFVAKALGELAAGVVRDALAEIERLSSQAPLQVSDEERALSERRYQGMMDKDAAIARVLEVCRKHDNCDYRCDRVKRFVAEVEAALATPRGET